MDQLRDSVKETDFVILQKHTDIHHFPLNNYTAFQKRLLFWHQCLIYLWLMLLLFWVVMILAFEMFINNASGFSYQN